MSQSGHPSARVRNCLIWLLETLMNSSAVDGDAVSSGKGTHKHLSRDDAADKTLAVLTAQWS
jgi:hypothetical protein